MTGSSTGRSTTSPWPTLEAADAATTYLIDRGCRSIAVIGANPAGGSVSAAALRLQGHTRALERADRRLDDRLVATASEWHQNDGAVAAHRLLNSGVPFDGLFCFNDNLAIGAMSVLLEAGLAIPKDVRVVGFDNVPAAAFAYPSLTTIDPGLAQISKTSTDLLAPGSRMGPRRSSEIVFEFLSRGRRSADPPAKRYRRLRRHVARPTYRRRPEPEDSASARAVSDHRS